MLNRRVLIADRDEADDIDHLPRPVRNLAGAPPAAVTILAYRCAYVVEDGVEGVQHARVGTCQGVFFDNEAVHATDQVQGVPVIHEVDPSVFALLHEVLETFGLVMGEEHQGLVYHGALFDVLALLGLVVGSGGVQGVGD
ncbi:hypothetical protein PG984_002966 [Apiospora sp. TS-2023a]